MNDNELGRIRLVSPTQEYAADIEQLRRELLESEEADGDDAFAGCGTLRDCESAERWLKVLAEMEQEETLPAGKVPSNTYLAVRIADNQIVGIIDLRHHINHPILGLWGGHMGYIVRPVERGKGYAAEMLKLNLQKCRERGMEKVMITCSPENHASEKTILANDGVFEKDVLVDGDVIRRYWVTL